MPAASKGSESGTALRNACALLPVTSLHEARCFYVIQPWSYVLQYSVLAPEMV